MNFSRSELFHTNTKVSLDRLVIMYPLTIQAFFLESNGSYTTLMHQRARMVLFETFAMVLCELRKKLYYSY